jgi:hypothetical protein
MTYYKFEFEKLTKDFDINLLLKAIDNKLINQNVNCSRLEFNYLSNAIEYIFRSYFKHNDIKDTITDLDKAIYNLELLKKEKNDKTI